MKQGKTLTELAAELTRQQETKHDYLAACGSMELSPLEKGDGSVTNILRLSNPDSEFSMGFEVGETAHDQIAEYSGIPLPYYRKLRADAPALLNLNVNHWFSKSQDDVRMVRTLDGKARAFLSSRYRPLDNYDLAEIVLPELQDSGCRIESCEVTDKKMYIKAVTPKLEYEVKKGDVVQAGIIISNSEIGAGSLSVEPLLFRLVCANGLILNDMRMRKAHLGRGLRPDLDGAVQYFRDETRKADDHAFWLKVRDTVKAIFSSVDFDNLSQRFFASASDKIEGDPIAVVEVTKKTWGLSDSERNGVLKHLLSSGDMSRFGLVNAVTRTAQDVSSYDRSVELERLGGVVLELPKSQWSTISTAA